MARKPRILTSNNTTGRPGFKSGTTRAADSGKKVAKDTAGSVQSPRRLIARDPADGISANIGTEKDVPILGTVVPAVNATLDTNLTGADNDLHYEAKVGGVVGNAITITYTDPGGTTAAFSVAVVANAITVNLARAASAITTTANDIIAGILASAPASALVNVSLKTGNSGAGIVTALGATHLAGGAEAVTTPDDAVNTVGPQSPSVVKAPSFKKGNATPTGTLSVAPGRNVNRGVRHTRINKS